jgi:hypothetical protein
VTSAGDDWSELDANGVGIGPNARERTPASGSGGAVLTLPPDGSLYGNLYDELVRLTDAGVEFVGQVSEHDWGRIASSKDSEGNDLQLHEPPSE